MIPQKIFNQIEQNIDTVVKKDTALGADLWNELLKIHPADIALFFSTINKENFKLLFTHLPDRLRVSVFSYLSNSMKALSLSFSNDRERAEFLEGVSIEKITDLFDYLSDEEVRKYFELLHKKDREEVIALMKFRPDSAGGIMDPYVVSLQDHFTVEQSIQILQKIKPNRDLHQQIYITDPENRLKGYIMLEDLVLKGSKTVLSSILRENELVVNVDEDKEEIAKKMMHYNLMTVPVIGNGDYFLGVIPSTTLVDIIEEEASEDVYKISAMAPIKKPYFETSFFRLCSERGFILIALLLFGSISSLILKSYQDFLANFCFLNIFLTMLVSTGGNTSSQTSAITIQGLSTGEINYANVWRFFKREFLISLVLAFVLGFVAFARVYLIQGGELQSLSYSLVVSFSLAVIVLVSMLLGSFIPLLLKKLNLDPAFSAGPFLATLMDILGILIYCYISKLILT